MTTTAPHWTTLDWRRYQRTIEVAGLRLNYVDYGTGPVVVLIHGLGGSWQTWLENIPTLGRTHRVIAVDLPGFGASEELPPQATFEDLVTRVWALLDRHGIAEATFFGHSLGGLVSLRAVQVEPNRSRGLVLISGGGAPMSRRRLALVLGVFKGVRLLFRIPGALAWVARKPWARALALRPAVYRPRRLPSRLAAEMVPLADAPGFLTAIRLGAAALREIRLDNIRTPALLIWGAEDRLLPVDTVGRRLLGALPHATLEVLAGVGHCAMFEAPQRVNDLAGSFLEILRGRTRP